MYLQELNIWVLGTIVVDNIWMTVCSQVKFWQNLSVLFFESLDCNVDSILVFASKDFAKTSRAPRSGSVETDFTDSLHLWPKLIRMATHGKACWSIIVKIDYYLYSKDAENKNTYWEPAVDDLSTIFKRLRSDFFLKLFIFS